MRNNLKDKLLLAPMAGVNDPVFRALCKRMGAAFTYTEMISSKGLAYGNTKTHKMIASLPEDTPYAVQLFGSEPEVMAAQARELCKEYGSNLVLIDINMGCPARKVASAGSGAALLQQPARAWDIVRAVSSAVQMPVTVKMRLLESGNLKSTIDFAEQMQKAGAAALTIHGRTAAQMYQGTANRSIIEPLVSALSVPVIASGDVFSAHDYNEYFERGATAVMIARGVRGNPWLFANHVPTLEERVAVAREHTQQLYSLDPHKLVWMRKHLAWYFKGTPGAVAIRRAVQQAVSLQDYLDILERCL